MGNGGSDIIDFIGDVIGGIGGGGITGDLTNQLLQQQIQFLSDQINAIIAKYKPNIDKANKLVEDLKKLDLTDIGQKMTNINQNIASNLNTIIEDQKAKVDMIEDLGTIQLIGQNPDFTLQNILRILDTIFTVISIVQLVLAPTPAGIAMEVFLAIVDVIMTIISTIQQIQAIEDLSKKLAELEKYFGSGGQYWKDMKTLGEVSYQMIENFYVFVIGAAGMIYELTININLLSISSSCLKLNYKGYIEALKKSPFDAAFEKECKQAYENFISIQDCQFLQERMVKSCKYFEEFEAKTNFTAKLKVFAQILSQFKKDSALGKELERVSADRTKLAQQRDKYKPRFQKRKNVKPEDLPKQDADIFQDMVDTFDKLDEPEISVVQVVSFFTTEFFADDPTGKTLRGKDLKEMFEKTESLNYLGVTSTGNNIIYLPKPQDPDLAKWWDFTQSKLSDGYKASQPGVEFTVKKMYMRIQCAAFIANNEEKSRLNFYYGILINPKSSQLDQFYQKLASEVTDHSSSTRALPTQIQEFEKQGKNLKLLCAQLNLYINLIAYPERIIKFSIFKHGDMYKGVVVWSYQRVKPEFFGKSLQCKVYNLAEGKDKIESKGPIFYEQSFVQEQSLVSVTAK